MSKKVAPKRTSPVRIIIIVVLFFGAGLLVAYAINSKKPASANAAAGEQKPGTSVPLKPALGIPVPPMEFPSEVKAYMKDVLQAPIPADYTLPENVKNQPDYNYAVGQVGKNFPEFNGLEGEQLMLAVMANPYRYQELIREARATRELYHPGTQPRIPPTDMP